MATATPKARPVQRVKMRIRKGDTVKVIAGKDRGKTGEVLRTLPELNRVVVQGINSITGHFVDRSGDAYIDVFSCKSFDLDEVRSLVDEYFRPAAVRVTYLTRQA